MHWLNRSISNKQVLGQVTLGQFTLGLFVFGSKLFGLNFGLTAIFWDKFPLGQISVGSNFLFLGQISIWSNFLGWIFLGSNYLGPNNWDRFSVHLKCVHFKPFYREKKMVTNGWVPQYLKKMGNFPQGGEWKFWKLFPLFLFIFKHGLNHPEMKRNFFSKVGTPPTLFSTSGKFPNLFLSFSYFANFGDGSHILGALGEGSTILGVYLPPNLGMGPLF